MEGRPSSSPMAQDAAPRVYGYLAVLGSSDDTVEARFPLTSATLLIGRDARDGLRVQTRAPCAARLEHDPATGKARLHKLDRGSASSDQVEIDGVAIAGATEGEEGRTVPANSILQIGICRLRWLPRSEPDVTQMTPLPSPAISRTVRERSASGSNLADPEPPPALWARPTETQVSTGALSPGRGDVLDAKIGDTSGALLNDVRRSPATAPSKAHSSNAGPCRAGLPPTKRISGGPNALRAASPSPQLPQSVSPDNAPMAPVASPREEQPARPRSIVQSPSGGAPEPLGRRMTRARAAKGGTNATGAGKAEAKDSKKRKSRATDEPVVKRTLRARK